jgi:hypothetical protein
VKIISWNNWNKSFITKEQIVGNKNNITGNNRKTIGNKISCGTNFLKQLEVWNKPFIMRNNMEIYEGQPHRLGGTKPFIIRNM